MKLSFLYTENVTSEDWKKKLSGLVRSRGFRSSKQKNLDKAVDKAFKDVISDYIENPLAVQRLKAYRASIMNVPELLGSQNPYETAKELFRQRADLNTKRRTADREHARRREMIKDKLRKDPDLAYKLLGLNPESAQHTWYK